MKRMDVVVGDRLRWRERSWKVVQIGVVAKDGVMLLHGDGLFVAKLKRVRQQGAEAVISLSEAAKLVRRSKQTVREKAPAWERLSRMFERGQIKSLRVGS